MRVWDSFRRLAAKAKTRQPRASRREKMRLRRALRPRDLRMERFEDRVLLSINPPNVVQQVAWEQTLDAAIARAGNLAQYSDEQLAAVDRWVVGLAEGTGAAQIAAAAGATAANANELLPGAYVLAFDSPPDAAQLADTLNSLGGVKFAYPLVPLEREVRFVPNDPLFAQQWHLDASHANLVTAWDTVGPGTTPLRGAGVVIGVVDDGLEYTHPDLDDHYRTDLDFDFVDGDADPLPGTTVDAHGTAVAGIAAAVGNNALGVSGAAPQAELAGLRLLGGSITDATEGAALSHLTQDIHVYNNSWGPTNGFGFVEGPGPLALAALQDGVTNGRGGLGNIYVWAGGDGGEFGENVNYDGYANSRFTIAVAAIDNSGVQSFYSEPGAPLLISAYSSGAALGITTTDPVGAAGYDPGDYTNTFGGASAATPLVSGVVALMLEANPNLTYRDVQRILVETAKQNDPADLDWTTNAAGYHINHKYGFGAIDAPAAVITALDWESVGGEADMLVATSGQIDVNRTIPDGNTMGINSSVTLGPEVGFIEWVEVTFDADHPYSGNMEIVLISPSGTESILAEPHAQTDPANHQFKNWTFTSARHWGESSDGDWNLVVRDPVTGDQGTWNWWSITVYGGEAVAGQGPDLVAVIPNEGQVLTLDMEGHQFQIAPRELLLRFNEGQQIDPATLGAVRLIRSVDGQFGNQDPATGQILDQEVEFGWIGIGDWDNEVIVRFAQNLPDDLYRLVIVGSDTYLDLGGNPVAPLANTRGVTFRSDYPEDQRDLEFDFELNLGPQVVAVVPQPVVRGPVMTVQNLPGDGEVFGLNGGAGVVLFEFDDTSLGNGYQSGRVPVQFNSATATPSDVAAAIRTAIEGQISAGTIPNVGGVSADGREVIIDGQRATVQYGGAAIQVEHLRQLRKVIEVFFNEDDLLDTPQGAENPNFYQVFVTQDSATPADDTIILPDTVAYDPATNKAVLTFADDLASYGTGAFRLRIGNEYQPVLTDFQVAPGDAGTSFATAIDVRSGIGGTLAPNFGNGFSPQSLIIAGSIEPFALDFTLEWPGAIDEPGHRDLPNYPSLAIEDHFGGESAPDGLAGVVTVPFFFPDIYGADQYGTPLQNLITEAQKDRTREIFALFGQYLGIQFYESPFGGLAIATGDLAAFGLQSVVGGVAGVAGGGLALMDYAEDWGASEFGGAWFVTAMHEVGHLLGFGHTYDLPPLTIMGQEVAVGLQMTSEPTFPGDHDILHGQHKFRPDSIDIDMYRFQLDKPGLFSAEILAERMDNSSLLDSVITLYDETGRVIARNDDYYSEDSALEVYLGAGTYYIGVTASGNTQYDPDIPDTGIGGVTQGDYELRLSFDPRAVNPNDPATFAVDVNNPATISHIVDQTGVLLDGDYDGVPGGVYNFWFNVHPESETLFVDKLSSVPPASQDGSLAAPYNTISAAFAAAGSGQIVRIVGNNFDNDDPANPATLRDNVPYEIGYDLFGQPLSDGPRMEVPRGVTVMIDAGAVLKLRQANIDVGSSSEGVDRSGGALQVLGTPQNRVYFTSHFDETIGMDTAPLMVTKPEEGDWGGLVFRNNLDYDFIAAYDPASGDPSRQVLETQGIFLNYVNHADIRFGGGEVLVNGVRGVYIPIHMVEARPTVTFNTITNSADAAISGDPNSFADTDFQNWDHDQPFTADYERIGPQVYGNLLKAVYATSINPNDVDFVPRDRINTINGMFVRVNTLAGRPMEKLEVPGRFDDWDIVHVVSENLSIKGTPGGPMRTATTTKLQRVDAYHLQTPNGDGIEDGETFAIFDGSTRVVFEFNLTSDWVARGTGSFVAGRVEIRYNRSNDPDPGNPASTQDEMANLIVQAINDAHDNLGLDVTAVNIGGGRIELLTTAPVWKLEGFGTLDSRTDARLQVDPGLIVKLSGSRIEAEFGAQLIAEGRPAANESAPGYPVIFTSLLDTRYGAGGTFDTTEDTSSRTPQPGDWGGLIFAPTSTASIDEALIAYGGGVTPIEGTFARFSPVEVRQAQARVTNTRFEFNDAGSAGDRNGRGSLQPATIFVRGAQPIIVANTFLGNDGAVVSIDANSLKYWVVPDWGRSTGPLSAFDEYADNYGPMVRANRLGVVDNPNLTNDINGMEVRPAVLTTQSIWDDTDIVHVLRGEIVVPEHHHVGGLRLQSSTNGSLVVKLSGSNAGFTAQGRPLEIDDRIGGTIQVLGVPGNPVILTDLADDSAGAGFGLRGQPQLDTNGNGPTTGNPGAWRSIRFERYSNDRNVAVVNEREPGAGVTGDPNATPLTSQPLGQLAPYEKAGDDNLRLGFEVHGFIRSDFPDDVDVYQFDATAGTEIWIDIDWTTFALDSIVELIDVNGTVIARSDNSHQPNSHSTKNDPDAGLLGLGMDRDPFIRHDFYTMNPRDPGMRLVLPGPTGQVRTYYVRVRGDGFTAGKYQMQIRLREMQEVAGSTVQYADIRYATNGIEVRGFPQHSPLLGETAESTSGNNTMGAAQYIGNLLTTDRNAISLAGYLSGRTDVDWYRIDLDYKAIQSMPGINDAGSIISTIFDIDYADGMARPDLALWVFDSQGRLILMSEDSNIADDRPTPTAGNSLDDLSRGSLGAGDPYIGPAYLPEGNGVTYYVAVTSVLATPQVLSSVLGGTWSADRLANPLVRVEPIDSIARVVEEHVDSGPNSFIEAVNPNVSPTPSSDPGGVQRLSLVPDEFQLGDVVFYALTGTDLYTVDPFTGAVETDVTDWADPYLPGSPSIVYHDIAMRNDGRLMTVTQEGSGANFNPRYREFDTGNANNLLLDTDTGIDVIRRDPANPTNLQADPKNSVYIEAMVHRSYNTGNGGRDVFVVGYVPNPDLSLAGATSGRNLVWLLDSNGNAINHPRINSGELASGNRLFSNIVPVGELFSAPTILANQASQTEPVYQFPGGVQPLDYLDGDWFTVTNASGASKEFEFDLGIDVRLNPLGAANFRDGQWFSLINDDNGATYSFEFNSGPVIVLPTSATNDLDGVVVTVNGFAPGGGNASVSFEFDNNNTANSANVRVPFSNGDGGNALAAALVAAINARTEFTVVASAVNRRVSLENDDASTPPTTTNDPTSQVAIEGNSTVTPDRQPISFEETWTSQQLGQRIETVVDASQSGLQNPIDASYAFRSTTTAEPTSPGDRITFLNARTTSSFDGTDGNMMYVEGSPGVGGRVPVRFGAGYTNVQMAQAIARAINSAHMGVTASRVGATVQLFGARASDPVTLDNAPQLAFTGEGVGGDITGLAYVKLSETDNRLFAVSDRGGLYYVTQETAWANGGSWGFEPSEDDASPRFFRRVPGAGPQLHFIGQVLNPATGQPIQFSGLAAGPRNVEDARYAQTLFASDKSGNVWVMNENGDLLGIFTGGQTSVDPPSPVGTIYGIDFSPIDYNLWHWTNQRWNDEGHGIYQTFDDTRVPQEGYNPKWQGYTSYYFGLDDPGGDPNQLQPGANNFTTGQNSDGSRLQTYNLPGGAHGSLTTGTFSLEGYTSADKPTLYFTYYAETQNSADFDGLRVFVSNDGADWRLVATNTDLNDISLINPRIDQPGTAGTYIREVHDVGGSWRQARIDLSQFAGMDNLRVRFDFSTASDMDIGNLDTAGEYLVAPAAAELHDGDTFDIDGVRFEFDLGYALVLPNVTGVQIKDGEYFRVFDGTNTFRFEFDKLGDGINPLQPGEDAAIAVNVSDTMTARQVADRIASVVNASGLGATAFVPTDNHFQGPNGNRVFLINATSVTQGTFDPTAPLALVIEGSAPGQYTLANVPVYVRPNMDQLEVSRLVTNAVNRRFRILPDRIYIPPAMTAATLVGTAFTITGLSNVNVPQEMTFTFSPDAPPGSPTVGTVYLGGATTPALIARRIAEAINLANSTTAWQVTGTHDGFVQLGGPQTLFNGLNPLNPANSPLRATDVNETTIKLDEGEDDPRGQAKPLMHVYTRRVTNAGPLFHKNFLEGDTTSKHYGLSARQNNRFYDYRRGQNNSFEGWYIDDVIIGFAERGEMITNAPAGATLFDFAGGPVPTSPLVVVGDYQLEIRRGDEYGVLLSPPDSPYRVVRLFSQADTQDRWTQAFTLSLPAASDIAHGDRFWLEDGVNRQEFIFHDSVIRGSTGNAIPIYFTAAMSDGEIADGTAEAINQAYAQGRLNVTAASPGTSSRVDMWGVTAAGGTIGGMPLSQTISGSVEAVLQERFRLLPGAGSGIEHRDTFRIEDGTNAVDFIYLTNFSGELPPEGMYAIYFDFDMTSQTIANRTAAAINQAEGDGRLNVTATANVVMGSVDLVGATAVDGINYTTFYVSTPPAGVRYFHPDAAGNPLIGDRNLERQKGQIIIANNSIMYSQVYGIRVEPSARDAQGQWPHPASGRTIATQNNLVPGTMIVNNVVAYSGTGGILFSGDPNPAGDPVGAIPFGRIVNNTIYGPKGSTPAGVGIEVANNAGPTLLNNVVANLSVGIRVDVSSRTNTVVGGTVYQNNTQNLVGTTASSFETVAPATPSLFVAPDRENFYPREFSPVIDSSIDSLEERFGYYTAVLQPVGIPVSPIKAPETDLYGQLRKDDPRVAPPPGLGSNVFKDRGAIDRVDFVGPSASLISPQDNGPNDRDPARDDVVLTGQRVMEFVIDLQDVGVGIDDATLVPQAVNVYVDNDTVPLVSGQDYFFIYDRTNDQIHLLPAAGIWRSGRVYTVVLDRNLIRDLADNQLEPNRGQPDPLYGDAYFRINVAGIDFGDAPDPTYPSLLANDGARHLLISDYYLGLGATSEPDSPQAAGDRFDDGVTFQYGFSIRVQPDPGQPRDQVGVSVYVTTPASWLLGPTDTAGYLNAWIDFNRDGDWDDAGEQIFANVVLNPGLNSYDYGTGFLVFDVPHNAQLGSTWARFRLTKDPWSQGVVGEADNGEVEDYELEIVDAYKDFGDAPAAYPVTGANAAWHAIQPTGNPHLAFPDPNNPGQFLPAPDPEVTGQPTPDAQGDDITGADDENGVMIEYLIPGQRPEITVYAATDGYLSAWIDFDRNNAWDPIEESVVSGVFLTAGEHLLHQEFTLPIVPSYTPLGYTYARFRFTSDAGWTPSPTGGAPDGEVEDYRIPVIDQPQDFGDAPITYGTLLVDDGARHVIVEGIRLGQAIDIDIVDGQPDGQPHPQALGDDTDAEGDDEDGLLDYGRRLPGVAGLDGRLVPGETSYFQVDVTGLGYLSVWIDYNNDGTWNGFTNPSNGQVVDEWVLQAAQVTDDSVPFEFSVSVPADLPAGPAIARFRYSSDRVSVSSPVGPAPDGEVEDHLLQIEVGNAAIAGWKFNDENANGIWDTQLAAQIPPIQSLPLHGGTPVLLLTNDGTTGAIPFGFDFEYFGTTYPSFYISNNGAISFGSAADTFNPSGFPQGVPMIAPFWADVDTRLQGGVVYLQTGTSPLRGNPFVQVDWVDVGFFDRTDPVNRPNLNRRNTFSLYVEDDPGGDIVAFIYHDMNWTTADPNGINGYGGQGAQVGFDSGDGVNYFSVARPTTQADLDQLTTRQTYGFRMDPATGQPSGREPGLPGMVVYLDQNNNGVRDPDERWTTTSPDNPVSPQDESGYYEFTGLFPGTYTVREEMGQAWAEWLQTHPRPGRLSYTAAGTLSVIASPVAAPPTQLPVVDGNTFTVSDGTKSIRFEYDTNNSLLNSGVVRVNLLGLATAQQVALATASAINTAAAAQGVNVSAGAVQDVVRLNGPRVVFTPESTPWRMSFQAPLPAQIGDGDLFFVGDSNVGARFEFDSDGLYDPANQQVDIAGLTTADQVAAALAAAINNAANLLGRNVSAVAAADNLALAGRTLVFEPITSPLPQPPSRINADQSYTVEVASGQTVGGVNFGNFERPHVSLTGVQVLEGNQGQFTQVDVTVRMTQSFGAPVQLHYRTADGTATAADSDYQPVVDQTLLLQAEGTPQGVWSYRPITSNDRNDYDFEVSGNSLIWETIDPDANQSDWELFLYDLETDTEIRVTNNSVNDRFASLYRENGKTYIVWVAPDTAPGQTDTEIFMQIYEPGVGLLPQAIQLTNNDYEDSGPVVSESHVAWWGRVSPNNIEIFVFDHQTGLDANHNLVGAPINVSNSVYNDYDPRISGDTVVWYGFDSLDMEIFIYSPATGTSRLTSNRLADESPRISDNGTGKNVIWRGFDGNDYELFHYSTTTGVVTRITDNDTADNAPSISGDNLVWQGQVGSEWEIFHYDLRNIGSAIPPRNISNNSLYDEYPVVAGDQVVWHTWDGNDWEVFQYQIGAGTIARNISDNDTYDWYPQASASAVVWRGFDGHDYEILAATYAEPEVTATIRLTIIGDNRVEPDEYFLLELFNAQVVGLGAGSVVVEQDGVPNPGGTAQVPIWILNDDGGVFGLDYGDAPASYGTLLADNGARHVINPPMYLGSSVDANVDGLPSANATGDDLSGTDDEDGVVFLTSLPAGGVAQIVVTASQAGYLDAWIDFNGDGNWGDPTHPTNPVDLNEQIFNARLLQPGPNVLQFNVPAEARIGNTFARFRFSSTGGLLYVGSAPDGEVEDYMVTISPARQSGVFLEGGTVYVIGTDQADTLSISAGLADQSHRIEFNGQVYNFPASQVGSINVEGRLGNDSLTINGTTGRETADLYAGFGTVTGSSVVISYSGIETASVYGRGGNDDARLFDLAGQYDRFTATPSYGLMTGGGYSRRASGFATVTGVSRSGEGDSAKLYDNPSGVDSFVAGPQSSTLTGDAYQVGTQAFRYVTAYSRGGADTAQLNDNPATRDWLVGNAGNAYAKLYSNGFFVAASGFNNVTATSGGGSDGALLYGDPTVDDTFTATPSAADLVGGPYHYRAEGFRYVTADAGAGVGTDTATLHDDPASYDRLYTTADYAVFYSDNFYNRVFGFRSVTATSSGGNDSAKLYDDVALQETFVAYATYATMTSPTYQRRVENFRYVQAYSSGGNDVANFYDSGGNDVFIGRPGYGRMYDTFYFNSATDFAQITARSTAGGFDRAELYDTVIGGTVDHLEAQKGPPNDWARVTNFATGYWVWVIDFDRVDAASSDPVDTENIGAAVDFLFRYGEWS